MLHNAGESFRPSILPGAKGLTSLSRVGPIGICGLKLAAVYMLEDHNRPANSFDVDMCRVGCRYALV